MLIRWSRFSSAVFCAVMAGLLCQGVSGCGRKKPPETVEDEPQNEVDAPASSSDSRKSTQKTSSTTKSQPHIGDIPLDVWFDNPLEIVANKAPVGGAQTTVAATPATGASKPATEPMPENKTPAPMTTAATGGKDDWKSLISGDDVSNEVKLIKAKLSDSLQSVGKYNGNYKDIQVEAAVLSALAGIMGSHPDSLTWKDDAKYIRDISATLGEASKGLGQASYEPSRSAYDKLDALLTGNKPPDLPEAAQTVPFSEVAKRGPLMRRMDRAFQWMKSNVPNEESLKKSTDIVSHEAVILATLAKVIATAEYASYEEEEYQAYIKDMIKANQEMSAAAKESNFAAFSDALSRCQKACNDCHQAYRFADG